MARHMRLAGEIQPNLVSQRTASPHTVERLPNPTEEATFATNNVGTGANATTHQPPQVAPGVDVRELMEQSNRLAERFNQLLERSNELAERSNSPGDQSNPLIKQFGQVLERFIQLAEQTQRPAESDPLAERFNQLLERFNQVVEQSNQPMEQSNRLAERFNQLFERSNQNHEKSHRLTEELIKPVTKIGDVLGNVNRVLVRIQHAIVRNHQGNSAYAADCLVNEKGETPGVGKGALYYTLRGISQGHAHNPGDRIPVTVVGGNLNIPDRWLGTFLHFYNIGEGLCHEESETSLIAGKVDDARQRLGNYFSTCLG
ncbi:hypothetical protein FRC11_003376 [Ceratobasidium sp. 423]|nr:hypothetical protein FRC11_003376 [Ceratobasidium sp. 423]